MEDVLEEEVTFGQAAPFGAIDVGPAAERGDLDTVLLDLGAVDSILDPADACIFVLVASNEPWQDVSIAFFKADFVGGGRLTVCCVTVAHSRIVPGGDRLVDFEDDAVVEVVCRFSIRAASVDAIARAALC